MKSGSSAFTAFRHRAEMKLGMPVQKFLLPSRIFHWCRCVLRQLCHLFTFSYPLCNERICFLIFRPLFELLITYLLSLSPLFFALTIYTRTPFHFLQLSTVVKLFVFHLLFFIASVSVSTFALWKFNFSSFWDAVCTLKSLSVLLSWLRFYSLPASEHWRAPFESWEDLALRTAAALKRGN